MVAHTPCACRARAPACADAPPTSHASEYKREYQSPRSKPFTNPADSAMDAIFQKTKVPGLRSEEMITVGQYTPVLRTYT